MEKKDILEPVVLPIKEEDMEYNEEGELVPKSYTGNFKRNPNGASRFLPDPRQEICWELYVKGFREGKPNAKKAATEAGYSPNTALVINGIKWFIDRKAKLKRKSMFSKAERNLSRALDMEYTSMKLLEDGTEVEEINIDKLKVVVDVSKLIVTTLGKDDGYSTKVIEDKNFNHDIKIESISYADPIKISNEVVQNILNDEIREQ